MKKTIVLSVLSIITFCSWTYLQQENKLKKAEWLIGTWESKNQRGSIYETWEKINSFELSGKSYMIKEKDTIVFETVQLLEGKNTLYYIPKVKNQNGDLPVRFTAKIVSDTELIFENQVHDFPQIISYTKINTDSLVAEISGTKNGKERNQKFPMKRVK